MDWAVLEIKDRSFIPPSQSQPYFVLPPPPTLSSQSNSASNFTTEVSPGVFLAIIILSVMFFILGALHLFVRILLRPPARADLGPDPDEAEDLTALQGQLQQLFHLHDAGVDQSFIDTLPVFNYKAIIGVKDPFDCAVCLCEFVDEDELRLLPECSHAFHLECIDTWLLSHSTCPLCRASLVGDNGRRCSPIVLVLESRSGSSREIGFGPEMGLGRIDPSDEDLDRKCSEIEAKGDEGVKGKVVPIKFGKFKSLDGDEGSADYTTNNNDNDEDGNTCGARRCFSMGSFAYVMDENSSLQVPIRTTPMKRQFTKKPSLPLEPGHRPARSVCDCESGREFNGFEALKIVENENQCIGGNKKESLSVSKIWLRGKKGNGCASAATIGPSRRAFSFRFPSAGDDWTAKNGGVLPEIGLENPGSEMGSCRSCLNDQENTSSFARRTLFWIMGKPNKVVHSSFASNV